MKQINVNCQAVLRSKQVICEAKFIACFLPIHHHNIHGRNHCTVMTSIMAVPVTDHGHDGHLLHHGDALRGDRRDHDLCGRNDLLFPSCCGKSCGARPHHRQNRDLDLYHGGHDCGGHHGVYHHDVYRQGVHHHGVDHHGVLDGRNGQLLSSFRAICPSWHVYDAHYDSPQPQPLLRQRTGCRSPSPYILAAPQLLRRWSVRSSASRCLYSQHDVPVLRTVPGRIP